MTITCAIIDDEPLALELLQSYVAQTPFMELKGAYSSAIEALDGLRKEPADIVFTDIQMPELDGLSFSKTLNENTRIVFTSAFEQYAIEGYRVNALDYLLKPISYNDFLITAKKAQKWFKQKKKESPPEMQKPQENSLFVKSDYKLLRINFDDIRYIEGLKDYVKIYTDSQSRPILSLISMHTIEEALPSSMFMRIHRSYIVNMSKVEVVERGQIVFGDKYLPVSDSYKERVQEYINSRLLGK